MKTTIYLSALVLCLFASDLAGQACTPPHTTSCDPNANFCDPTPLSNITCRPFRFTGLDGYWSFVGDGSTITITVTPNICFPGPPPGDGISAQLLEDCSPVTTLPPPSHNLTDIVYTTEPCKVYTLYVLKVPGCSCDEITINVMSSGGGGPPMIPRPVNLDVDGEPCVCGEIEVCADITAPCNLLYQWEINGAPRPDLEDLECIDYEIQSSAPVTICLNAILGSQAIKCDEVKVCTTITPRQLPPEEEPLEVICWEDHMDGGYQWYDKTLFSSCINPPCTTKLQDRDGCCYDLIQPIILRRRPITTVKSVILCDSTELPYVTEDGQKWEESVCNEIIMFEDPKYDCDTQYALTISILDPKVIVDRICDKPNELVLTADAELDIKCPIGIVTSRLEWTDCVTGDVISTDTFLVITQPGQYCLNMIVNYTNVDGTMGECIKEIGMYDIGPNDFGQISVDIMGDTVVCEGFNGFYQAVPNSGISNYTWTIPSGNGQIVTPNANQNANIEVNWNITPGDSGVLCLEANEDCVSGDTCITVLVLERPDPDAMNDTLLCGTSSPLQVLSQLGSGMWVALNDSSNQTNIIDPSSASTSVSVDSFGSYTFVWTEGPDGCSGSDTVSIHFLESPSALLLDTICDPEGKYYLVSLQIQGGTGPYNIISGGGSLDSMNQYASDTIWANGILDLVLQDSFGCILSYTLQHQCDCGSIQTGTLDPGLLEACEDQCIDIFTNNDHTIENGQCVIMVLHRDSLLDLNNPYTDTLEIQEYNDLGNQFCFDPTTMIGGTTYYVHYLVTRCDDQSGEADLTFACMQYATVPIVFHNYPEPDAGPDYMLCGLDTVLQASLAAGNQGSWTRISGPGNAFFAQDMPVSPLTVDQYGEHVFVWTEDNNGCTASDTIRIRFLDAPVINDWVLECDSLQQNFRLIITDILGGDMPSHSVSGQTIGGNTWQASENNGQWSSPWIQAGDSIVVVVNDQYGCFPDTLTIRYECECATSLGNLVVDPTEFCGPNGQAVATYTGGSKGIDDIEVFYLHQGGSNAISGIIDFNQTGQFSFDPGSMQLNQVYYITVRVGIDDGTGAVNPDYECLVESEGIPVVWYDVPQAVVGADIDSFYCHVDSIVLDGTQSSQNAPMGQLQFEWSNASVIGQSSSLSIREPGTYQLVVTNSATGCSDTTEIQISDVPGPESAQFSLDHPDCNGPTTGSLQILGVASGRAPYQYSIDGGNPQSQVDFRNLTPGQHVLTIVDRNGCSIDSTFEIFESTEIEVKAREDQYLNEGESIDLDSLLLSLTGDIQGARVYWVNAQGDSILVGRDGTLLDSLTQAENPFTLVAINEDGCISIDYLTIFIQVETPNVFIPNVISPNGDNINDVFRVFVSSDKIDHIDRMQIFTRWGELIYQNAQIITFDTGGVSVSGWDGTFQGEKMNPGVYVYTVDLVDNRGEHQLYAGSVTLIE